jgi:hypothetical protein
VAAHDDRSPLLWTSDNPRFGVVRNVIVSGAFAARLDDLNGDYREVELTLFRRRRRGWEEVASADDVGHPEYDGSGAEGWGDGYLWAFGRDAPDDLVEVRYAGRAHRLRADSKGWWLFVRRVPDPPPSLLGRPWVTASVVRF